PRRDDERGRPGERPEVGRDVRRVREAAVDTAEAPCAHEPDPDPAADRQRPAYGGRADPSLCDASREISRAGLPRAPVEPGQLLRREPDANASLEHTDRRGDGPGRAHAPLGLEPHLDPLSRREAVRDERRLERDHRRAIAERPLDLGRELDHGIAPSLATQRPAASAASSGPPTRNPAVSASPAPVESTTGPPGASTAVSRPFSTTVKPRAPSLTTRTGASSSPSASHSCLFPNTTSGSRWASRSRRRAGPKSRIAVQADRSILSRPAHRPAAASAASAI